MFARRRPRCACLPAELEWLARRRVLASEQRVKDACFSLFLLCRCPLAQTSVTALERCNQGAFAPGHHVSSTSRSRDRRPTVDIAGRRPVAASQRFFRLVHVQRTLYDFVSPQPPWASTVHIG